MQWPLQVKRDLTDWLSHSSALSPFSVSYRPLVTLSRVTPFACFVKLHTHPSYISEPPPHRRSLRLCLSLSLHVACQSFPYRSSSPCGANFVVPSPHLFFALSHVSSHFSLALFLLKSRNYYQQSFEPDSSIDNVTPCLEFPWREKFGCYEILWFFFAEITKKKLSTRNFENETPQQLDGSIDNHFSGNVASLEKLYQMTSQLTIDEKRESHFCPP